MYPGNTWPQPARRAAALYHEGMAPYIVVSGRYSKGQQTFAGAACEGDRYKGAYMTEAGFPDGCAYTGGSAGDGGFAGTESGIYP